MHGFCEHAHKMLCRWKVGTWGKIKTDLSKEEWHANTVIELSMAAFKGIGGGGGGFRLFSRVY